MAVTEQELQEIVRSVLSQMNGLRPSEQEETGIYDTMEEAIEAAARAQKEIRRMPLEFREKIISNIRKLTLENLQTLAEMGVAETKMGNVGHKIIKHRLVAEKTPGTEDLSTIAWSGDRGLTLVEQGPFGVIGAITPSTNPSETVLCNSIGMLAAGNSVVFNPHPSAIGVSSFAVSLVNKASIMAGGPGSIAATVKKPTLATADVMYKSKDIPLLVATGGPGVVTAVLSTGKRAIGAGAGNPPVVVDETADIPHAAESIINGATLDNNLPCIAEKEVVVVDSVADELIAEMQNCGAYLLTDADKIAKLSEMVVVPNKKGKMAVSRDWVGRDAYKFLRALGIDADPSIKCIILEAPEEHILVQTELMMPILQNVGNFGLIVFAWLTGVITDMMMTPLAGMAAFSPLFIDIAAKLGLSVIGTTFSFVWGVEQLFFPYEWALFLILFSYDVFDMKKAMKFCTVRTILSIIFLMVLIYPYWMMTGFLR